MDIKTLLMQNLSYAHYLSALHHNIQNLAAISPPTKVLPPCFCCPYARLLTQLIAFFGLSSGQRNIWIIETNLWFDKLTMTMYVTLSLSKGHAQTHQHL